MGCIARYIVESGYGKKQVVYYFCVEIHFSVCNYITSRVMPLFLYWSRSKPLLLLLWNWYIFFSFSHIYSIYLFITLISTNININIRCLLINVISNNINSRTRRMPYNSAIGSQCIFYCTRVSGDPAKHPENETVLNIRSINHSPFPLRSVSIKLMTKQKL